MEFPCGDLVDKSACGMPKLSDQDDRAVFCEGDHRRGTGVAHHFQLDRKAIGQGHRLDVKRDHFPCVQVLRHDEETR